MSLASLVDRDAAAAPLAAGVAPLAAPESSHLAWLKAMRAEAVERVGALRLPTSHDEAWRFTGISALAGESFPPAAGDAVATAAEIERFRIDEAAIRLVFIDGAHVAALSRGGDDASSSPGALAGPLAAAGTAHGAALRSHLGQHAAFRDDPFVALNTAFLRDAAVVVVPQETIVDRPVHLLFVASQAGAASHPRVLVVAGAGSRITVIEDHVSLHAESGLTNAVAELAVGAGAQVAHVRIQRASDAAFHIGACAVSLERDARYRSVSVALGAKLSRLDLAVRQAGEGADCTLDGLALIGGRQVADTHTIIDHAKPHGTSRQLHKCIVDGAAHAVFSGKVMVRPGAEKTDSAQSSRNLLLTGKAVVDTLPQLEIFADDVKCTHGATVGQLDAEEVFYLQSRGLSQDVARNLLTYAFGAEVIDRIPVDSLRRRLEQAVIERTAPRP